MRTARGARALALALALCYLASTTLAALPPGYDEELYCPPGHCLLPKKVKPGFVGPRTALLLCATYDGVVLDVEP